MAVDDDKPSPEREQTDEGLREEREKTDRALRERQQMVEEDADAVVDRARENADALLSAAREEADRQFEQTAARGTPVSTIDEERALEDAALRDERAAADDRLRRERDESVRALKRLLPLERDATDRYLLTERNRSDDELTNRDDFLGIVSHDLRDLLSGIVMSAALLAKRAAKSADGGETLAETARIQRYAARMNRLVGDLVDVASIDAGKLAVTAVRADASRLVNESLGMFEGAASAKGVRLEADPATGPLWAAFDHDRMLQVFANVLGNAVKFTPSGGRITVRSEPSEGEIRFCISDTGAGIPGDLLEAIFERFWQVGKNDRRGLGLGLYIARCIVEAHGGRIWAESTLGEGSEVSFTLPVAIAGSPTAS